jgi:hypothetical protein
MEWGLLLTGLDAVVRDQSSRVVEIVGVVGVLGIVLLF